MVEAGGTTPAVILVAAVRVTFAVAVLLTRTTSSLAVLVPDAVLVAAACPGTLLCAMTSVTKLSQNAKLYSLSPQLS